MSLKAITWVMENAPVESPAEMVILYALADRAHDDGSTAWPSYQWIADRAVCSRRTVIRHIKAMEKRGLIKRGDQRFVQHLPSDKRPTVWDLDLSLRRQPKEPAGCQSDTPRTTGVSSRADRGDSSCNTGVSSRAERGDKGDTQSVLEPSVEPSLNHSPPTPSGAEGGKGKSDYPPAFENWYQRYPRKKSKRDALKAWEKAIKRIDAQDLNAVTDRFAAWCQREGKDRQFIPYPASWLNSDGWEDDLSETKQPSNSFLAAVRQRNENPQHDHQQVSRPGWADVLQIGGDK